MRPAIRVLINKIYCSESTDRSSFREVNIYYHSSPEFYCIMSIIGYTAKIDISITEKSNFCFDIDDSIFIEKISFGSKSSFADFRRNVITNNKFSRNIVEFEKFSHKPIQETIYISFSARFVGIRNPRKFFIALTSNRNEKLKIPPIIFSTHSTEGIFDENYINNSKDKITTDSHSENYHVGNLFRTRHTNGHFRKNKNGRIIWINSYYRR